VLALFEKGETPPPELLAKAREHFRRMYQGGYTAFEKWAT
jgi:hypothetical protein